MALIYKVTCKTTGKVYVGQTIRTFEERKREHLKQARLNTKEFSLLHKAIRKYGKEDFEWVVLEECSLEESDDREIFYIEKEKSFVRDGGYNLKERKKRLKNGKKNYPGIIIGIIKD
jgi:group I intron endonuclease